jgi:hypothetical protein
LLNEAQTHKLEGNTLFQATEPDLDGAIGSYKAALELLPVISLTPEPDNKKDPELAPQSSDQSDPTATTSGVVELTEEQAEAIIRADEERQAEITRREEEEKNPVIMERRQLEREIEDVKKAVWGNLGAVHVKKGDDKEAVKACTEGEPRRM